MMAGTRKRGNHFDLYCYADRSPPITVVRNEFFEAALRIEQEMGVMVVHETHRRRVLYNPFVARDLCRKVRVYPHIALVVTHVLSSLR